jgi:solute carrier family 24 (sodium/potassium/calcium exchanger), member 6
MYLLASTADAYLSPSLEHITVSSGISESLAGVTLLAFGNGAPDVLTSIAAASTATKKPDAIGSVSIICGGTFFITCIVVTAASSFANLNANKPGAPKDRRIKITPRYILRDIAFLFITVSYLLSVFIFLHEFSIFTSLGLLIIYGVYIILVVQQSGKAEQDDSDEVSKADMFHQMVSIRRKKGQFEYDDFEDIAKEMERQDRESEKRL